MELLRARAAKRNRALIFAPGVAPSPIRRGARASCDIDSEKARALTLSQLFLDSLGSLEQSLPREGIFGQVERRRRLMVLRLE